LIALEQLTKRFGAFTAVDRLDLAVPKGEVFGFLGPNGAGKTTTLRMLMGILVPTTGRASIGGLDCHTQRVEVMRRVGYLPDVPVFYDYLRGAEILEFVGEMHDLARGDARARARELLREFDLGDAGEEFAVNYSLGMKKKLGLACAVLHRPDVLILDEPTTGLDPGSARDVRDFLQRRAGEGATIFLSTHLLDMAERLCSRVGIIHQGVLQCVGRVDELRASRAAGGTLEDVFLAVTRESSAPTDPSRPPPGPAE
jgi:ABC-2 type transport system ATP-binding protein